MAHCKECKRFTENVQDEPIVEGLEVEDPGLITGTITITNSCAECGNTVRTATFDINIDIGKEYTAHKCPEGEGDGVWTAEADNMERTYRQHPPNKARKYTFYGAEGDIDYKCSCGKVSGTEHWKDEIVASQMETL